MSVLFDEIGKASKKHQASIREALGSLTLQFGIDTFWRNYHCYDGSYSVLGNDPSRAEYFFGEKLYMGHPFFRDPSLLGRGYLLPDLLKTEEYEGTQGRFREVGTCYHVLTHFREGAEGVIEYGFARSRPQPGFEAVYLNHLDLFDRFIEYFESSLLHVVQDAYSCRVDISLLLQETYSQAPHIQWPTQGDREEPLQVERNLRLEDLTMSERACLKIYLTGATAQEVARTLHRSPRTVETHLQRAKEKIGVRSRSELYRTIMPYRKLL